MKRLPSILLSLVAPAIIAGCAYEKKASPEDASGGSESMDVGYKEEDSIDRKSRPEDEIGADDDTPADEKPGDDGDGDDDDDLAPDPHSERPGGPRKNPPKKVLVLFSEPADDLEPILSDARPGIESAAKLAVVCVRKGKLVRDAAAFVKLETLLSEDPELGTLRLLLPRVTETTVLSVDDLAVLARKRKEALLLVDVRYEEGKLVRVGWLLHTRAGKQKKDIVLLARYEIARKRKDTLPSESADDAGPDLVSRVGLAYARLKP